MSRYRRFRTKGVPRRTSNLSVSRVGRIQEHCENSPRSPQGRRSSPRTRAHRLSKVSGRFTSQCLEMNVEGDRAKDNFDDLFQGSENIQIDPESCVPFVTVRSICKSGVARLVAAFDGRAGIPGHSKGHSSAGGLPVVVKLSEASVDVVVSYFMERDNVSEAQAREKAGKRSDWFGIVDGAHRHAALMILVDLKPESYKKFNWWVTRINNAPINRLKAFACSRNEFQRKEHIVDFTVYDVLSNMREIAVSLAIDRGTVLETGKKLPHGFLRDLADLYCGGRNCATDTIRQMAGVVVKLSPVVIETIGGIVNEESQELANKAEMRKNKRTRAQYIDARPFRKTINTFTLRGASKFLNNQHDIDRVNALYRVKFLAHEYNYKGTPREVLEKQLERAVAARLEAEKFEGMLKSHEWPEGMKLLHKNLLRTTKLDSEVERNEGNDNVLLPSAEKLYRELYPSSALHKIQVWSRVSNVASDERDGTLNDLTDKSDSNQQTEGAIGNVNGRTETSQLNTSECGTGESASFPTNHASDLPQPPSNPCIEVGIETFQMRFDAYDVRYFGDSVSPFDFIIGDPSMTGCFPGEPSKSKVVIDDKGMDEFSQFSCRVLVPGGYLFLFTNLDYYKRWEQALLSRGFDVMPNAFVVVRDSEKVQSSNSRKWPQNVFEIGIVAQAPGDHPSHFRIDLDTPYVQIPKNAHKRKFAAITGVPATSSKLTRPKRRILIRANERPPQLVSELITTFCRPGGRVLDPFANVFTTGISCLATGRSCTLLETDPECFDLAKKRLEMLANIYAREHILSSDERNKKRNRTMTSAEELESLNRVLEHMESASLDDFTVVSGASTHVEGVVADCFETQLSVDKGDTETRSAINSISRRGSACILGEGVSE